MYLILGLISKSMLIIHEFNINYAYLSGFKIKGSPLVRTLVKIAADY